MKIGPDGAKPATGDISPETVDDDAVVEGYRLLLNRKPESADVIAQKSKLESLNALVQSLAMANEFLFAHRSALVRHLHPRPVTIAPSTPSAFSAPREHADR